MQHPAWNCLSCPAAAFLFAESVLSDSVFHNISPLCSDTDECCEFFGFSVSESEAVSKGVPWITPKVNYWDLPKGQYPRCQFRTLGVYSRNRHRFRYDDCPPMEEVPCRSCGKVTESAIALCPEFSGTDTELNRKNEVPVCASPSRVHRKRPRRHSHPGRRPPKTILRSAQPPNRIRATSA